MTPCEGSEYSVAGCATIVRMRATLAVLFAALCFGTTGTAQALASVDASPLAVGAARILVGGGVLGAIALLPRFRGEDRPAAPSSHRRAVWPFVLVGALGVLAYQPFFFAGARLSGVALGTVVALGSAPVFTGALDAVIRRRLPSLHWCVVTAIAVVGVLLTSGLLGSGGSQVNPLGVLSSLGAGASYAVYTLASKRLLDLGWSSTRAMGALFGFAAIGSAPLLLIAGAEWLSAPRGIALALWLGLVTVTIAYLAFGWGLGSLHAGTVATLTLAEPLTATMLGIALLGERLSPVAALGLGVLVVAIVLLSLPASRTGTATEARATSDRARR